MPYLLDDDAFDRVMRMLLEWESGGRGPGQPGAGPVAFGFVPWHYGKLATALAASGSATVRIYVWDGSGWVDSGRDVTAYAGPLQGGRTIAQNKWVKIEWHHQARRWYITSAEC